MTPKGIRIAFWIVAVLSGGAQTWYTRHRILTDSISYLEIAQQYASGDWHAALNAYWSPLYSWVIAGYLTIFRPVPYWQVSTLHVVNFIAFLASCWIFEKFFRELTKDTAVLVIGYVTILHAGLLMVGIGFGSPDMIALFLTGLAAWLTLKIAQSESPGIYFAGLGLTLGFGYLDRTAFAPLSAVYVLATAFLLTKRPVRMAIVCTACLAVVAAPFVIAVSMKRGALTLGESGKLNYGWEVVGARRSTHWQGEPGDLGKPVHPTRIVLTSPVPVYEFAEPVAGSYPPWYDASYWYQGIAPHFKLMEQVKVLGLNVRTMLIYLGTTPAFLICILAIIWSRKLPRVNWALILPVIAGIAMYCIVFIDKRYIAGFFAVLWITVLSGVSIPQWKYTESAARGLALLFVAALLVWLRPAFAMSVRDAVSGHEGEANVSWMMAQRFGELGVKPGERVAYIGSTISADWVRLAQAKVVAEVPIRWDRGTRLMNTVEPNEESTIRFFQLDETERAKVYQAFQSAGAQIAVTTRIPAGGNASDWTRVLDPNDPRYPKAGGQVLEQSPGYYRWLNK
jgi:hypothetical protein